MTREEFDIALDMSLTKDRTQLCLNYINQLENQVCENCKYYLEEFGTCNLSGDIISSPSVMKCNEHKRK